MGRFWRSNRRQRSGIWGSRLNWHVSFAREGNANRSSLERVAHAGSVLETTGGFQGQVQRFQKATTHRRLDIVPLAMELRIRRLGWAKRVAEHIQEDDLSHQQVLAVIVWTDALGQTPLHDERWEADILCHSMGKAVLR